MKPRMKPKLSPLFANVGLWLASSLSPLAGQSEYHWSDQFGSRSTLLNGTVIGGVSDLGAVFYNPARLAQLHRPGFLLTAEAFEVNQVEVGRGETNELEQSNFRGAPGKCGCLDLRDLSRPKKTDRAGCSDMGFYR